MASSSSCSPYFPPLAPPPRPPPSYLKHRWKYDVFLSFRGEDTRYNFVDHLYAALTRAGIFAFRDDERIETGASISSELKEAISESRIYIVVFSENYATSTWCLDELALIMDKIPPVKARLHFKRLFDHDRFDLDQFVLPIFYKINPSDVRHQTGSFGRAFADRQRRFEEDIMRTYAWRDALRRAAGLKGWELTETMHETRLIETIVQDVLGRVSKTSLHVATHPVGIPSRVVKINSLLSIGSNDVRMVGIYGMGGAGKTTIAKAVYNRNFQYFEGGCCFLENVREAAEQSSGLFCLQEQLLSELLKIKNFKIGSCDEAISCMQNRLRSKRVLIILDDLDNLDQVKSLAGDCNWFGPGSRIIVTTRDEHLLVAANINCRHKVEEITHNERLELFSLHAFNRTTPYDDFLVVSKGIVDYVGGLPLALEVLGGYLCGKTVKECYSAFQKLQKIPHNKILEKLRISYDGLGDADVKNIFLDIACFFIGMDRDYAINILKGCGFFPVIGIRILIDRCLLTVDKNNKLMMHNLIRDMGRDITQQESFDDPGKRSRLWDNEDVCYVLEKHKGTEAIQGVVPALPMSKEKPIGTETFQGMHRLRLLQIHCAHLKGCIKHLPEKLKWFSWHYCPLTCIPPRFRLQNLVVLDMQYNKIRSVGQDLKFLKNLEILFLSHSSSLTETPDFTGVVKLKMLFLNGCASLSTFHPSIGHLYKLTYLNMEDSCTKLKSLPSCICQLKSLEHLNLNGCSNLEDLPENIENLKHLRELFADGTAIRQLPDSLGNLKELKILSLKGCIKKSPHYGFSSILSLLSRRRNPESRFWPPSVSGLCCLTWLNLIDCNLSDGDILDSLGSLSSLQRLRLDGNDFHSLPSSIGQLSKLELLSVDGCRNLQSLPKLPTKLVWLHAASCTSMEKLPILSDVNRFLHLYLTNCHRLGAIQGLENLTSVQLILIEGCNNLATTFKDSFFQGYSEHADISNMCFSRRNIPVWFHHRRMGSTISFDIPLHVENNFLGMTLWLVYKVDKKDGHVMTHPSEAIIMNKTICVPLRHQFPLVCDPPIPGTHSWVFHVPVNYFPYPIDGGEEMEVSFELNQSLQVECGVHLIFKSKDGKGDKGQFPFVNSDVDSTRTVDNMSLKRPRIVELAETSSKLSKDADSQRLR